MYTIPKNILNELVNSDGTRIGGNNVKLSRDNSKSSSDSTMDPMYNPEDGDQVRNSVVQSTRQQGYRGYYSLVPMPSVKTPNATINTYTDNIDYMDDKKGVKKTIKKISKKKMEEMVEDIVSKKISKDVIDDVKTYNVINKNGIPDIEIISDENPLLVRKVKNLIDIVKKNQANGEQKGVILNFLVNNIDTIDIPVEYKKEILKKLQ
jgi:hypothetical protein